MKPKNRKQTVGAQEVPELFTFDHNHKPVRVKMIDGEPWFVGKDIATILGYADTKKAVEQHVDEEDKLIFKLSDIQEGGVLPPHMKGSKIVLIRESGVYALIFGSTLPRAKEFKHWVTSVLLPVVRKTGKYAPGEVENDCPYTNPPVTWEEIHGVPPAFCQATPEWLLDLMNDVCRVEDSGLRAGMADKLMAAHRIQ
jgi:prophage antirepressor-like protein